MTIPENPSITFIAFSLFLIGLFLFISGLNILRIEKITVSHGFRTWFIGLVLMASGAFFEYYHNFNSEKKVSKVIKNISNPGFERDKEQWDFKKYSNDYEKGIDVVVFHNGKKSAYISSKVTNSKEFATISRMYHYINKVKGKRIQMSAYIKTLNVKKEAGLWMRINLDNNNFIVDNMSGRSASSTNNWKMYSIVLDVPNNAKSIRFGAIFEGSGKAWYDDFNFKIVGRDIDTTEIN